MNTNTPPKPGDSPLPVDPPGNRQPSAIDQLSEVQKAQLHDWLDEGHTRKKILELIAEHFGVKTHTNTLRRYCQRRAADELRAERNLDASLSVEFLHASSVEEFDKAAVDFLKHKLYLLGRDGEADTIEFARLFRLRLRMNDQQLSREKFEFSAAKAILKNFHKIAEIVPKGPIDPREERAILDQIRLKTFGCLTDAEQPLTGEDPYPRSSRREEAPNEMPCATKTPFGGENNQSLVTSSATYKLSSSRREEAPIKSPCGTEVVSAESDNHSLLTSSATKKPEPIYTRLNPREDGWYPPIAPEEFELKYPGQPYDPYPESTIGNAVIMKREKPFQVVKKSTERIRLAPPSPTEILRAHPVFQETCEGTFDLLSDGWYVAEQCDDLGTYFLITNNKLEVPYPWRQYEGDLYKGIYSVRKVQR